MASVEGSGRQEEDTMSESGTPGANIAIRSVPNVRDLGGWTTRDGGTVRRGLLYRGTELDKLAGDDMAAFAKLGIRTVFDLRTEDERTAQPDRVPESTAQVVCDVLADEHNAAPAQVLAVLNDPNGAEEMLGGGKAVALFEKGYREIVSLPSALQSYRRFFAALASEEHRPAYFHCTTGKDRTGWAAAALLTLFGVSEEDVMREYLLTNDELVPALQPVLDEFQASGGDPELLMPVVGVQREYLEASFDEMLTRFGSLEGYFADGLGIDEDDRHALTDVFVERSEP
jgi:protein-tyrosine phosphatase